MIIIAYGLIEDVQRKYSDVSDSYNSCYTYCVAEIYCPNEIETDYYSVEDVEYCITLPEAENWADRIAYEYHKKSYHVKIEEL